MKLIINKNRTVTSVGTWGTENENNYEVLDLEFPQELQDYNKRIVYYLDDDRKWDVILNNRILIPNSVTKYERVKAYIWCTLSEEITLHYICDGTETGDYYFSYNGITHYFTMPEVEENDELIYDVANNTLKLGDTTIETTLIGTGDELNFSTIIDAAEDFRTQLFEMQFYENENADGIVPTPEEVDGFNTMLTAMNEKIDEVDDKIDEIDEIVDSKIDEIDIKIDEVDEAVTGIENLNIDVSDKVDGDVSVTLTKKNGTTKTVVLSDGTSLMFQWIGTSLGIKTEDEEHYTYVDLQGIQGPVGPKGEAFTIKKTYSSVSEMNADFNNMQLGDYVMIASTVEVEDNAKLYTRGEQQWIFISDFSGAQGIKGETGTTPNIQIGTVVSGAEPGVTRSGTNENPVLNFTLVKGDKGDTGNTGATGATGNGIASIEKTGTNVLVDTYTITYTNGNTTTFTVTNAKSIVSIAKTSTAGLVDTYTITYNDGTSSTFEITNGQDGEVTQEQLDEVQEQVTDIQEFIESELDSATTQKATRVDINDSAKWYGRLIPFGRTYQKQYQGYNLINFSNPNTTRKITINQSNDTFIFQGEDDNYVYAEYNITDVYKNNPNKTLKLAYESLTKSEENMYGIVAQITVKYNDDTPTSYLPLVNSSLYNTSRTIPADTSNIANAIFRIATNNSSSDHQANTITMVKPMLQFGTEILDYEPYCGGIPSPSPDYPQEIQNVEGRSCTNLLNLDLALNSKSSSVAPSNILPNSVTVSGKGTWGNWRVVYANEKNVNKTISYNVLSNIAKKCGISVLGGNNTNFESLTSIATDTADITANTKTARSFTFNTGNYDYLVISFWNNASSTALSETGTTDFTEVQINKGSIELPYEPYFEGKRLEFKVANGNDSTAQGYEEQTILFPLATGQKLMEGDYLADDGLHHIRGKVVLNGTETWNKYEAIDTDNYYGYRVNAPTDMKIPPDGNTLTNYACDKFTEIKWGLMLHIGNYPAFAIRYDNARVYIHAPFATIAELTEWLSNNNMTIEYDLTQEVIDPYTEAQQEAYNQLKRLMLYYGTNYIWTETDGLEPNMQLTYYKSNKLVLENLEARVSALES